MDMNAGSLVSTAFYAISPTTDIHAIKDKLLRCSFLIVKDKGFFHGLLTPQDVIDTPRNLVVDCLHEKPRINMGDDLDSVLQIMKITRNTILPVFDGDTFIGVISHWDISDYHVKCIIELENMVEKSASALLEKDRQLMQAQRMESVGTMTAGIIHEFKNLLCPIIGYAEMMQHDFSDNLLIRDKLTDLLFAAHNAKNLVAQILDFSRKSNMPHHPVNLQSAVLNAIQLLRVSIPRTIRIRGCFDQPCSLIMGDPIQINQILMNLCINAFQSMEEIGGNIDINLSDIQLAPEAMACQKGLKPGLYVRLSVSDTGPGIKPDVLNRIFEPYYSTKDPENGTGLGLAVTHEIVEKHDGAIEVFSQPGKGATFHVYLPAIESGKSNETKITNGIF